MLYNGSINLFLRTAAPALVLAIGLSGCISSSAIQRKYVSEQDDCRSTVADALSHVGGSDNPATSTTAGVQFSECMNKAGWHVALPKPSQVAGGPAPNPPTGSPSTNPSAATAAAPQPTPVAPVPKKVVPPTAPTVNTPSAPLPASSPAPATYQPARPPSASGVTPYGQGGGRQF